MEAIAVLRLADRGCGLLTVDFDMTIRSIPLATVVCGLLLTSPALAVDFSRVRCEDPKFISFIETKLPSMVTGAGQVFQQNFSGQKVTRSDTVSAVPNEIVCKVTLDLSFRGTSRPINGEFIAKQLGTKLRLDWLPRY